MKIVIPGGSGQIGTVLASALHRDGHEVVVLSRAPRPALWRIVGWDGRSLGEWTGELEGADVVINLAGRSVNCRYHAANRAEILQSRVDSTRVVGAAIAQCARPPRAWLQASTATIYAHREDAPNDERNGTLGGDEIHAPDTWRFSTDVARAWERTLDETIVPGTRKVKMRSAIVMSPGRGGAFDILFNLVRLGLGGAQGDGQQFVSWIHHQDFVRAVYWLIAHEELDGVVNLTAPNPLPNAAFMRALREAAGMKLGLPAPAWLIEVGAFFLRTESELVLKSRRVVPGRLREGGFTFDYPTWPPAAAELVRAWRTRQLQKSASPIKSS